MKTLDIVWARLISSWYLESVSKWSFSLQRLIYRYRNTRFYKQKKYAEVPRLFRDIAVRKPIDIKMLSFFIQSICTRLWVSLIIILCGDALLWLPASFLVLFFSSSCLLTLLLAADQHVTRYILVCLWFLYINDWLGISLIIQNQIFTL